MSDKVLTILAIECSTSACSVALRGPSGPIADQSAPGRQAEAMVPLIGSVMEAAGLDWPDISLIGVTVGPGSFTGLRIGLAAARGLALARGLPLAGVTTADLLAFSVPPELYRDRTLLIAIDSKRDDLFIQGPGGDILAMLPEEALRAHPGPLLVAGDAAERFRGLRADIEIHSLLPNAAPLAELALRRFRDGTALPAQPLYVRPPDVSKPAP